MKGEGENFRFLVGSSFPREEGQGVGGIPKVASLGKSPTKLVGISSFGSQAKKAKKRKEKKARGRLGLSPPCRRFRTYERRCSCPLPSLFVFVFLTNTPNVSPHKFGFASKAFLKFLHCISMPAFFFSPRKKKNAPSADIRKSR